MRRTLSGLILAVLLLPTLAAAHCEVPCGIFTDALRIEILREHATTIEKAMVQIEALSAEDQPDYNQLVRWVTTKETHAEEFQHVVSQYFLHQRVKPSGTDDEAYVEKLTLLHQLLVGAMRTKQSTDTERVARLRELIDAFAGAYFTPQDLEHLNEHRN